MFSRTLLSLGLALAWAAPAFASNTPANTTPSSELDVLRAQLAALKNDYETRIAALETRLQAGETGRAAASASVSESGFASNAISGSTSGMGIGLILQGQYAHRDDLAERRLTGFAPIGGHAHGSDRGFSLNHSELILSGNIDPTFSGQAIFAVADEEVEVEEAWFQTLGLGHGLALKGGRFASGLGYLNTHHQHAWDFVDAPLMYSALFGERHSQDGLQLTWLAPTETFLQLGLEAGRGGAIAGDYSGNGAGALAAFAKVGGDIDESHSWRAGLAYLSAKPRNRVGHWEDDTLPDPVETETLFSGTSRTWVADFIWKWAPDGNPKSRNFKFQAEYFQRDESGDLTCADNLANGGLCPPGDITDTYNTRQSGWYTQATYQFMPRWRTGLRFDQLDSGKQTLGAGFAGVLSSVDYTPRKTSLMLDYSPSEFSRLRLQYALDRSMQGISENQWTLQYVMSLGAHGAHAF